MLSIGDTVYWLDIKIESKKCESEKLNLLLEYTTRIVRGNKFSGTIESGRIIACSFFGKFVSVLHNGNIITKTKTSLFNDYDHVLRSIGHGSYHHVYPTDFLDRTPYDGP